MNAVQGNADSVNQEFYGSLDASGRNVLGFSPEPLNKNHVTISAMENLNADLRDPAFYRLYKKIIDIGIRFGLHTHILSPCIFLAMLDSISSIIKQFISGAKLT